MINIFEIVKTALREIINDNFSSRFVSVANQIPCSLDTVTICGLHQVFWGLLSMSPGLQNTLVAHNGLDPKGPF